jgi:hypothetical protein
VAREGHVLIHLKPRFDGLSHHLIVAKRIGGSCTQVGEPETSNRQTRRSPAHSRHNSDSAGAKKPAKKTQNVFALVIGSPNPIALFGRRPGL